MTEQFDPYYQWLGIRPQDQPPDHYQLLGLRRFEDNPEAIQHAADRQIAHLRTVRAGEHAALAQKLLDEVATAARCLLTPATKVAYDASLQGEEPQIASAFDESFLSEGWLPTTSLSRPKKPPKSRWPSRQVAITGGLCGVTLLVTVVLWLGGRSPPATVVDGTTAKPPRQPVKSSPPPVAKTPRPQEKPDALASPVSSEPHIPVPAAKDVAQAEIPENHGVIAQLAQEMPRAVPAEPPPQSPPPATKPASKPEMPQEKLPVPSLAVQNEIIAQINELACRT